jgi:hypothetical protein
MKDSQAVHGLAIFIASLRDNTASPLVRALAAFVFRIQQPRTKLNLNSASRLRSDPDFVRLIETIPCRTDEQAAVATLWRALDVRSDILKILGHDVGLA